MRLARPLALLAVLIAVAPAGAQAAPGLVAAYGFEETSGQQANDISGLGHDGTFQGDAFRTTGRFGLGLQMDGAGDMVSVADTAALDLDQGMTLEAYVLSSITAGQRPLVVKERPGGVAYSLYHRWTSGFPATRVRTSADFQAVGPSAVDTKSQWTHFAATYDGSRLRLYVNGTLHAEQTVSGSLFASDGALRIGANTNVAAEAFKGRLDEVRVYDRALSASEIQVDMITPVGTAPPGPADQQGTWSAPANWPLVPVHMQLLSNGKVLTNDAWEFAPDTQRLWDPETGAFTPVPYGRNLFCSAHVSLPDGRALMAGGNVNPNVGIKDTTIFDWRDMSWTRGPDMARARWYPTTVTLPDGRVLTMSGDNVSENPSDPQPSLRVYSDTLPEIYDPVANTWTSVPSASRKAAYYPQLYVTPDGKVADVGPELTTRVLDLATGTWTNVATSPFDGHSSVMYRPGKVLKAGSFASVALPNLTLTNRAATIDLGAANPSWTEVGQMASPRAYHTLTALPDGTVLAANGTTDSDGIDGNAAVRRPEIWNPATGQWTAMNAAFYPRLYHSAALLLPDGRVLIGGGGRISGGTDYLNAEIFSPPYLHKGPRPVISAAPSQLVHGGSFTIDTPNAGDIQSVALIRAGSQTHSFNFDQRYVPLSFTQQSGSLSVDGPADAAEVPPGIYMLWIVNGDGVPSKAKMVSVPLQIDDQPPTAPPSLSATGGQGRVDLVWSAATDNVGVAGYEVHRSATAGFTPSAATRIATVTDLTYADTGLAPGTYHYRVRATDAADNVGPSSPEASAAVTADTNAPSVSLTAPADGATVSGNVGVSADASDDTGVAGVQFRLGDADLGSEDTSAPYQVTWDSRTVPAGTHTLTAVARDAAGNTTTSAPRSVTVDNSSSGGPVAAYGFDENSGTVAGDSSGNGNAGTLEGGATWTTGWFGRALQFDGAGWVTVPDASSLDATSGMTVEAWVFTSVANIQRPLVVKEGVGGVAYGLYHRVTGGLPAAFATTTSPFSATGSAPAQTRVWVHFAATYDGAQLRIYLNGALDGERAVTGNLATTSGALRIGANLGVLSERFKGRIDEVRVYDRALSAAEIATDMNTPVG
jgi:Concanavalin A-like lectin/glucanases superfamily/Domain of unknown function (DUF1929)/Bacterial Ig domain